MGHSSNWIFAYSSNFFGKTITFLSTYPAFIPLTSPSTRVPCKSRISVSRTGSPSELMPPNTYRSPSNATTPKNRNHGNQPTWTTPDTSTVFVIQRVGDYKKPCEMGFRAKLRVRIYNQRLTKSIVVVKVVVVVTAFSHYRKHKSKIRSNCWIKFWINCFSIVDPSVTFTHDQNYRTNTL